MFPIPNSLDCVNWSISTEVRLSFYRKPGPMKGSFKKSWTGGSMCKCCSTCVWGSKSTCNGRVGSVPEAKMNDIVNRMKGEQLKRLTPTWRLFMVTQENWQRRVVLSAHTTPPPPQLRVAVCVNRQFVPICAQPLLVLSGSGGLVVNTGLHLIGGLSEVEECSVVCAGNIYKQQETTWGLRWRGRVIIDNTNPSNHSMVIWIFYSVNAVFRVPLVLESVAMLPESVHRAIRLSLDQGTLVVDLHTGLGVWITSDLLWFNQVTQLRFRRSWKSILVCHNRT